MVEGRCEEVCGAFANLPEDAGASDTVLHPKSFMRSLESCSFLWPGLSRTFAGHLECAARHAGMVARDVPTPREPIPPRPLTIEVSGYAGTAGSGWTLAVSLFALVWATGRALGSWARARRALRTAQALAEAGAQGKYGVAVALSGTMVADGDALADVAPGGALLQDTSVQDSSGRVFRITARTSCVTLPSPLASAPGKVLRLAGVLASDPSPAVDLRAPAAVLVLPLAQGSVVLAERPFADAPQRNARLAALGAVLAVGGVVAVVSLFAGFIEQVFTGHEVTGRITEVSPAVDAGSNVVVTSEQAGGSLDVVLPGAREVGTEVRCLSLAGRLSWIGAEASEELTRLYIAAGVALVLSVAAARLARRRGVQLNELV